MKVGEGRKGGSLSVELPCGEGEKEIGEEEGESGEGEKEIGEEEGESGEAAAVCRRHISEGR